MKLWTARRAYTRTRRMAQIISVLARYGFGEVLHQMNLARPARRVSRLFGRREPPAELEGSLAVRLRKAFEELGPTFIKLGQLMSSRPDIFPEEVITEMQKLQRQAPPAPFEEISAIIDRELSGGVEGAFASIDPDPVGSASVAQVHRATLRSGAPVAVKVIRPGADRLVRSDVEIIQFLVSQLSRRVEEVAVFQPMEIMEQFRRSIQRELDLTTEAFSMTRFAENFADDDTVVIPGVHWGLSTSRVLTMDFIDGIPLADRDALETAGVDLGAFARRGADMLLTQVFVHGFFHGDPHPGNIYCVEGGRVGLLDYGLTGKLSRTLTEQLGNMLWAISRQDAGYLTQALLEINLGDREINLVALREDLADFVTSYYGIPLGLLRVRRVVAEGFGILSRHGIRIPSQLTLLLKVLAQVDDVGRRLDPDFSVAAAIEPFARDIMRQRVEPARLARDNLDLAREVWSLVLRAPEDIAAIVRKVRSGKLRIELGHQGLREFSREQDRISNRLSFAIITGSIIVGSSLLSSSGIGPKFMGMPVLGLTGFLIAGGLGLWLLAGILRSGKL